MPTMAEVQERLKNNKGKRKPWESREDYSPVRAGISDFLESSVGLGDEADALFRRLSGTDETWDEALEASRDNLDYFERHNEGISKAISVAGFGAGMIIPGAGMAKFAQTGTKLSRAIKGAALGSAEGAAYGYASGRDEERLSSAAFGAGLGGVAGGAVGGLLTKNADDIAKATERSQGLAKGGHIGGDDGYSRLAASEKGGAMDMSTQDSINARKRQYLNADDQVEGVSEIEQSKFRNTLDNIFLNNREWADKKVGNHFGSLMARADLDARIRSTEIDEAMHELSSTKAAEMLSQDKFKKALWNLGQRFEFDDIRDIKKAKADGLKPELKRKGKGFTTARMTWADVRKLASNEEELQALDELESVTKAVLDTQRDPKLRLNKDYFPRELLGEIPNGKHRVLDEYKDPLVGLKSVANDLATNNAMIDNFFPDDTAYLQSLDSFRKTAAGKKSYPSQLDETIEVIKHQMAKEGAPPGAIENAGSILRSNFIAARKGGDSAGAIIRKVASTGLLANLSNAVLSGSEMLVSPINQSGIKATFKALPRTLRSALSENLGTEDARHLSNSQLGISKNHMGEISQAGEKELTKQIEKVSKGFYDFMGVSTVNRAGQENISNAAVIRGKELAGIISDPKATPAAKEKAMRSLRKHAGARGFDKREITTLVNDLNSGQTTKWVKYFAGQSRDQFHQVSAVSMPKAYHDNPNGRVFYSMLSYMNGQANFLRRNIGLKLMDVQKYGLNSKQGEAAFLDAMKESAKYTATFGVLAGLWDDGRKELFDGTDEREFDELLTVEGMSKAAFNQLASNASSGLVNIRSEQFGGKPFEPIPAPVKMMFDGGSGLLNAPFDGGNDLARFTQSYVPGFSQADRLTRMATGQRLLTEGGQMDQGMLYDLINQ